MRIYLIAPRNPESFWTFDRVLPHLGKKCAFPNLSLPTVAGLTPPEHEVILCDENVEPIDFDVDADMIGVTGYVIHRQRILEIVDAFKRRGRFVVAGGPFASLCPEELRGKVDVLFVDEAEETWPQFLRDHAAGAWRAEYTPAEKPGLQDAPMPRFDLLKVDAYRSMTIQFARGCPYSCEFCDIIVMYGRKPRTKTVPQVMAEVDTVHRLGVPNIFIVDDNFIGNKREAKALLRAIAAWQEARGYPIEFMTEVTLNVAQDAELLALLRAAHFTSVFIGIESPRAASLQETRKTQNLRENLVDAVHRVQAAGIEVMAGMIVGFDHDDTAIFDEQFEFIQAARVPISMTGLLNAVPRTPLYERLKAARRLVADHLGDQFVFTNVIPQAMSRLELYEGYQRLLERLYTYRAFRRRTMDLILHRGTEIKATVRASRRDLTILLRVVWACVLRTSPRRAWMTLAIFAETALRRPRQLRLAVSSVLVHRHFSGYVRDVSRQLDRLIAELRVLPEPGLLPRPTPPSGPSTV